MNITTSEYYTFNVGNSLLLVGQTGSGKSYLVHSLLKRFKNTLSTDELKLVIFDLKHIEFVDEPEEYLFCPVILDPEEGLTKLEDLAELAVSRSKEVEPQPMLFIYIEECDIAALNQERFDAAVIAINQHAKAANIKLIYSTSRPSSEVISEKLKASFDLILAGKLASGVDRGYIGAPNQEDLQPYSFNVIEK